MGCALQNSTSKKHEATDATLLRLQAANTNDGYGFSNHGPMYVEALEHLDATQHLDASMIIGYSSLPSTS